MVLYEKEGKVGEKNNYVYDNGSCIIYHYSWGMDNAYNHGGEVEYIATRDKGITTLLMLRTVTKGGKDLLNAIHQASIRRNSMRFPKSGSGVTCLSKRH